MMNWPFLIAAVLCLIIGCIHAFTGSRTDVRPLLDSDIPEPAKSTLYYCWHLVTIVLFSMAVSFAWTGLQPEVRMPGVACTLLSSAFSLWGFVIVLLRKRSLLTEMPQGWMFAIVAVIGLWGVFG